MNTLLVMRHAKSSWSDPQLADFDRPLNKRGQRDAPRMGELLREHDLVPDRIFCSSAQRARETASLVVQASGFSGTVETTDQLYHASPDAYLALLRQQADMPRVMVIGHNPGLEELVFRLTDLDETLPTAAVARISLGDWNEIGNAPATLECVWRPKEL